MAGLAVRLAAEVQQSRGYSKTLDQEQRMQRSTYRALGLYQLTWAVVRNQGGLPELPVPLALSR